MPTLVLARSAPKVRLINDEPAETEVFVGATKQGILSEVGVGIIDNTNKTVRLWGPLAPHRLIQSWRAMWLLEHVVRIDTDTLHDAWYVAAPEIKSIDTPAFDALTERIGSIDGLLALRAEILDRMIDTSELDQAITFLRLSGILIDGHELEDEILRGGILGTSSVMQAIADYHTAFMPTERET